MLESVWRRRVLSFHGISIKVFSFDHYFRSWCSAQNANKQEKLNGKWQIFYEQENRMGRRGGAKQTNKQFIMRKTMRNSSKRAKKVEMIFAIDYILMCCGYKVNWNARHSRIAAIHTFHPPYTVYTRIPASIYYQHMYVAYVRRTYDQYAMQKKRRRERIDKLKHVQREDGTRARRSPFRCILCAEMKRKRYVKKKKK